MSSMNRVFLAGNLTREPELKRTNGNLAVAELGVAINEKYKGRDGETVERVCFADVVVWGRQAETCCEFLTKGAAVLVEGSLQLDRWETQDGQSRSKMRIRAQRVQFLGRMAADNAQSEHAENREAEVAVAPGEDENLPF